MELNIKELPEILREISQLKVGVAEIKTILLQNNIDKDYSVNELVKMGTIGKYTRIKSLIRKGILKTTASGSITQSEINNYLNNDKK